MSRRPDFDSPHLPDPTAALRFARLKAENVGAGAVRTGTHGGLLMTWKHTPADAARKLPARDVVELRRIDGVTLSPDDRGTLTWALGHVGDGMDVLEWTPVPEAEIIVATVGRVAPRSPLAYPAAGERAVAHA